MSKIVDILNQIKNPDTRLLINDLLISWSDYAEHLEDTNLAPFERMRDYANERDPIMSTSFKECIAGINDKEVRQHLAHMFINYKQGDPNDNRGKCAGLLRDRINELTEGMER